MNGCNNTYYIDGIHLNTKGYTYFASRLTSAFVGYGELNPVEVHNGTVLSIRGKRDGMVNNGAAFQQLADSVGPEEGTSGNAYYLELTNGDTVFFGFKAKEDSMVVIPIFRTNYGDGAERFKVNLDFSNEQSSHPLLSTIGQPPPHIKPISELSVTNYSGAQNLFDGTVNLTTTTKYIPITNKGWHNIELEHVGLAATLFYGFVVMSYREFKNLSDITTFPKTPAIQTFTPTVGAAGVNGTHTYVVQSAKYIIDTLRKTIKMSVVLDATIDNTIDGTVYIRGLPKVSNTTTSCVLSRISGFYSGSMQNISAYVSIGSNVIAFGKTDDTGNFVGLAGVISEVNQLR